MAIVMPTQEMIWTTDLFTYDDFVCARNYKCELGTTKKKVTIANFHTSIIVNIYEDGIFCVGHVELILMSIMIGCLSLCKNHNINAEASDKQLAIMRRSKGMSTVKNDLDKIMKHLGSVTDVKNCEEVANILDYYSNSKIVRDCYYSTYDKTAKTFKKKNKVPPALVSRCRDLLSKELDTSVFNIRNYKDNDIVEPYIPDDFMVLIKGLRKYLFLNKSMSEVIRMCFIQGLYILCDLIISEKICFEDRLTNSAVSKLNILYMKLRE